MGHPYSTPSEARQRWHSEARARDEAYVTTLPHDDAELRDLFAISEPFAEGAEA